MKINNLTLINYRRFEHQSFVFNDHFTAIIGNNATGKTQVLQAIVTLFSQYQFKMLSIKLSHAKSGEMEANAEITKLMCIIKVRCLTIKMAVTRFEWNMFIHLLFLQQ